MATGTIKNWNRDRGFGFIAADAGGDDLFVHFRDLAGSAEWLSPGTRVSFEVVTDEKKSKPKATKVRVI